MVLRRGSVACAILLSVVVTSSATSVSLLGAVGSDGDVGCSCDECVAAWQPEVSYLSAGTTPGKEPTASHGAALRCATQALALSEESVKKPARCERFCSESCAPKHVPVSVPAPLPGSVSASAPSAHVAPSALQCVGVRRSGPRSGLAFVEFERRRAERAVLRAGCPPVQKCLCWCHCPEILMGQPPPPGLPPVTAVNPFAPPPLPPPQPPPPYAAGPPPMQNAPFNPMAPVLLQDTGARQPCRGAECRPPSGCPAAMPCNCYCQCRPPVPSKKQTFEKL